MQRRTTLTQLRIFIPWVGLLVMSCGGAKQTVKEKPRVTMENSVSQVDGYAGKEGEARQSPPESAPPRDIKFPPIARTKLGTGLELNTVEWTKLPVVYVRLVVKSGGEADPADRPGVAHMVSEMLLEGTKTRSGAKLALETEQLGADLWTGSDEENSVIGLRVLKSKLPDAMALLSDVVMNVKFDKDELDKLKEREINRLVLLEKDPNHLAFREFHKTLYGKHPYGRVDVTAKDISRIYPFHLKGWHRVHYTPANAFLVVVGDVQSSEVEELAKRHFRTWKTRYGLPTVEYPAPPERQKRQIVVVDRPESVQSVIVMGNVAVSRSSDDFVPLDVSNQVLGGSAASRLFMDLREVRSLTYGAYSRVEERVDKGAFAAFASVRNEVTSEAVGAFFEHLVQITTQEPTGAELTNAKRYLSDSFPLQVDTPGKIARLVSQLRIYGLPDDYYESYRTNIVATSAEEAFGAAQKHIQPDKALVVVVGKASDIASKLEKYGPVTVIAAPKPDTVN